MDSENFIPKDLPLLKTFVFERLLNEDPLSHSLTLLGTFPTQVLNNSSDVQSRAPAVLRIEKTALSQSLVQNLTSLLHDVECIESNDIYTWLFGWFNRRDEAPDVKINIIFPATEVHIRKYSTQQIFMVHESPETYEKIVKPYIDAFPPSRTQWVEDILSGKTEAHKVLHKDSSSFGFIILPDMKWDLTTISSLYLVAITTSREIRSLRDLRKQHLPMLRSIKREASRVVKEKWGLGHGSLRLYVHYQPSYYHFHVHIINANYVGFMGMGVGQAHLLEDLITLLDVDSEDGPSIFERMTITYGLGENHGLFQGMRTTQAGQVL